MLNEYFQPGKKRLKKIPEDRLGFLKGLFDTDGSIHIEKGKYPVISICNNNEAILKEMRESLSEIGIKSYVYGPEFTEFNGRIFRLRVYGLKNHSVWKQKIGSNNPRKNRIMSSIRVKR